MTDAASWRPERVRVGTVGKPHGLDGSFRVSDPCGWWEFPQASLVLAIDTLNCRHRRVNADDHPRATAIRRVIHRVVWQRAIRTHVVH